MLGLMSLNYSERFMYLACLFIIPIIDSKIKYACLQRKLVLGCHSSDQQKSSSICSASSSSEKGLPSIDITFLAFYLSYSEPAIGIRITTGRGLLSLSPRATSMEWST